MGKGIPHYKYCRVIKMDKAGKYDVMCKNEKPVENDLEKQLKRFKSTLKRGEKYEQYKQK